MTVDSFVFFLQEFNLPLEPMPEDTRYVVIQFIEVGGDHLDSLMQFQPSQSQQQVYIVYISILNLNTHTHTFILNLRQDLPMSPKR